MYHYQGPRNDFFLRGPILLNNSPIHCVHFREKKAKKRLLAKPGFKPMITRVSTGGHFNHWATQLINEIRSNLEIYSDEFQVVLKVLWMNLNRFHCKKWLLQSSMDILEQVACWTFGNFASSDFPGKARQNIQLKSECFG